MNQFAQTTRSTINTIKAHALLSKALTNDTKPTPGYLYPDIALLTQLLKAITPSGHAGSSSVTSTHAQSFVGSAPGGPGASGASSSSSAYTSSPHVLLKALKILRQLAQSGSVEFRTLLARRGKALLVEMVGYKGPWDEVHGDRYNEDVRTVAEDLIEYMHANPVLEQDEQAMATELTDKEAAVLKSSTQDLQGFGHPDYEDSDSEDDTSRGKTQVKRTGTIQFRNATSSAVYELAQHVQPGLVRTKLLSSEPDIRSRGAGLLSVWGTAKDICDIVAEGVRNDASTADMAAQEGGVMQGVDQIVPTITGLVRDITDWIEQEDWERRLRYLVVLDALLAYPETKTALLDCSAMPVLLKTLESSRCQDAPQRSIRDLSQLLSEYSKKALHAKSRIPPPTSAPDSDDSRADAGTGMPDMMLLDLGPAPK
ncbi:hypothetical protein BGZ68_009100 [Mortierella alpina]|nr:hypothetical protein BGZ68_009100 [Mortierella alpina]